MLTLYANSAAGEECQGMSQNREFIKVYNDYTEVEIH